MSQSQKLKCLINKAISEFLKEYSVSQAKKDFEDYMFGSAREKPTADNVEVDTPKEHELFNALYNQIHSGGFGYRHLEDKHVVMLKDMIANNMYPDVLKKPTQKYVFRGMYFTDPELYENFLSDLKSDSMVYQDDYSSWTTSLEVAKRFANHFVLTNKEADIEFQKQNYFFVLLVANTSDSANTFLDMSGWYEEVSKTFKTEKEVAAVGPVKLTKVLHGKPVIKIG